MVTPAAKREAVAHLRSAFDMSERRACRTIGCVRMTVRYRCCRPDDAELRVRLRSLAHVRRRFGYRRLHVLLRREGFTVNHKRLFRLYREERLMVRRRGGRKRALGTRAPMLVPQWPNDRWSLDFVADQFIDGRRLRILVVVDDCTRECLALVPDTSISGTRVARELDRLMVAYGKPTTIVSDNGTELTSNAILRWTRRDKRKTRRIASAVETQGVSPRPGPPMFLRDSATLVPDRGLGVRRVGRVLQDVTHEIELKRLVVLRIWRNIASRSARPLRPSGVRAAKPRRSCRCVL
jgi:putative transposase